jgi:tetratricopeptide (TPR) repeat protein
VSGCGEKTNTKNAEEFFKAAKKYGTAGKYEKAVEFYTKAIESNPKYVKAYLNRGMIHDHQGRKEKAISDFLKVGELDKTDMYPAQQLARLYREKGDSRNEKKYEAEMEKRQQAAMSGTRSNKDQIDKQQKQKQDAKKKT